MSEPFDALQIGEYRPVVDEQELRFNNLCSIVREQHVAIVQLTKIVQKLALAIDALKENGQTA